MQNREVTVESEKKYSYDYLVISTGATSYIEKIPGLSKDYNTFYTSLKNAVKLRSIIRNFNRGKIVILTTSMPIPCPGAPSKFTVLLDDYLRYVKGKEVRENIEITFLWPIKSIGPPAYNTIISKTLREKGINDIREFKISEIDASRKEVVSMNGERIKYDLLITIPPYRSIKALIDSGITDEKGWVPNDKRTLQYHKSATERYDDVYVIGDTGRAEILKTGIGAHYQALITGQNLINDILGIDVKVPYRGETGCPLIRSSYTAFTKGEAYMASWNYNTPLKAFKPTKLGWFMYRIYYYIYWDSTIKALM